MTGDQQEKALKVWDRIAKLGPTYGTVEELGAQLFQLETPWIPSNTINKDKERVRQIKRAIERLFNHVEKLSPEFLCYLDAETDATVEMPPVVRSCGKGFKGAVGLLAEVIEAGEFALKVEQSQITPAKDGQPRNLRVYKLVAELAFRFMYAASELPTYAATGKTPRTPFAIFVCDVFSIIEIKSGYAELADFRLPCQNIVAIVKEPHLEEVVRCRDAGRPPSHLTRQTLLVFQDVNSTRTG